MLISWLSWPEVFMSRLEACSTIAQRKPCGVGILPARQSPPGRESLATKSNTLQAPPRSLSIAMALRPLRLRGSTPSMPRCPPRPLQRRDRDVDPGHHLRHTLVIEGVGGIGDLVVVGVAVERGVGDHHRIPALAPEVEVIGEVDPWNE